MSLGMSTRARAFIWLIFALMLSIGLFRVFSERIPIETNLLALLPKTEQNPLAETAITRLAESAGDRVLFLVGDASAAKARQTARDFAAALKQSGAFREVMADIPPFDPHALTAIYRPYRFNLLSEEDREAKFDENFLQKRLQEKLYAPFQFGLRFSIEEDPFGFLDAWFSALPLRNFALTLEDGLLVVHTDQKLWVMVTASLLGSSYDNKVQQAAMRAIEGAKALTIGGQEAPPEILETGTLFYAAQARESAEREMNIIGSGSLLGIICLLYLVFRSIRPLFLGLVSVGFGIAAAVYVTVLVYGELHLITLVFGASLIGEAIDYAIQYFAAHLGAGAAWNPEQGLRRIRSGLILALLTSLLGYGALMFAPFPALSQIALFALTGLFFAWLTVFLLLPSLLRTPSSRPLGRLVLSAQHFLVYCERHVRTKHCVILALVLLGIALPGWMHLQANDDIYILVARPKVFVEQEEKIRTLTGFGNSSQFFLVEGVSPDEVLAREEALRARLQPFIQAGVMTGIQSLSAFVPSTQKQAHNRALLEAGVFKKPEYLEVLFDNFGLKASIAKTLIQDFKAQNAHTLSIEAWLESPLAFPYKYLWLGKTDQGFASIVQPLGLSDVSAIANSAEGISGVSFVDKVGSISRLFKHYRQWGAVWVLGALCLIFFILLPRYGVKNAGLMLIPTGLSVLLAFSALGYLNIPVTLFNLMAAMLVLGVGVNYAIFLREGGIHAGATLAGVVLSAGTTLLSFGLLALSQMPALSSFGLTLLLGIGVAVLLAPLVTAMKE